MKHYPANILMIISLSLTLLGCEEEVTKAHHAKALEIDDRYSREIEFDIIGVTIPISKKDVFIRIDDPVSDIDKHQRDLLKELGVTSTNMWYSNAAWAGRQMYLTFADGKECSFIWVLKDPDDRKTKMRLEHEKFHALVSVSPSSIPLLSEAITLKGFDIDLSEYDEELSATIVEILSLDLQEIPLDQISGSDLVVKAVEILKKNTMSNQRVDPTESGS